MTAFNSVGSMFSGKHVEVSVNGAVLTAKNHGVRVYGIDLQNGFEIRGGDPKGSRRNWGWAQQSIAYIDEPVVLYYDANRRLTDPRLNSLHAANRAEVRDALLNLPIVEVRLGDRPDLFGVVYLVVAYLPSVKVTFVGQDKRRIFLLSHVLRRHGYAVSASDECADYDRMRAVERDFEDARERASERACGYESDDALPGNQDGR